MPEENSALPKRFPVSPSPISGQFSHWGNILLSLSSSRTTSPSSPLITFDPSPFASPTLEWRIPVTMISADFPFPCRYDEMGSPQVSPLTFTPSLPHLLHSPLISLGFTVSCQLTRIIQP